MKSDKKIVAGTQNWILPSRAGGVEIRSDVEIELVARALAAVGAR
jgi:hypothetical protein